MAHFCSTAACVGRDAVERVIRQGMKTHLDVNHHVGLHLHSLTATTCLPPPELLSCMHNVQGPVADHTEEEEEADANPRLIPV